MSKLIVPLIIGAIVLGGGSFYGGMQYQKSHTPASQGMRLIRGGGNGTGGQGFNRNGAAGFLNGQVLSKDDTSLTIKLRDGGSKNVFYSTSTKVSKMADGSLSDINAGTDVIVTGTPNQDGSITATMLQVRPAVSDIGAPPAGRPQGQP